MVRADSAQMGLAEFLAGGRPLELLSGTARRGMMEGANQKRFEMDCEPAPVPSPAAPWRLCNAGRTPRPSCPRASFRSP